MTVFPLSPAPSYYTQITPGAPFGVFYVGGTAPFVTLNKTGAAAYTVRDYYGNVVSTGSVSGLTLTPAAPVGGWKPGWYRLYLTGGSTDALFGPAYGSSNIVVLRNDSRFPTMPAPVTQGGGTNETREIPAKGVFGMGTTRLSISDVTNPSTGGDDIPTAQINVTQSASYWSVPSGNVYYDAARPRLMWANFPNDTSNTADVTSVVSQLYAAGVTRFEGPSNEPSLNAGLVTAMKNFHDAVKAASSNAVVIGPTPVSLDATPGGGLEQFLAAGGGDYIDEWAVHAYNSQTAGDINQARSQWGAFKAMLTKYGQQNKPLWQTESCNVFIPVYGVHHPRRARVPLLMTLLGEQQGIPRERQPYWYDDSHGFWNYPSWWQNSDHTVQPFAALYRTLAEETFGQTHSAVLSFGTLGDRIFLGSIYTGSAGSTAVLVAQSFMPGATVTLSIAGATSPLTVVDGFGNNSTVTITAGKAVIPVSDIPTYVRLPVGASVTVATCNDWPADRSGWVSSANPSTVRVSGGVSPLGDLIDNQWITQYTGGAGDGVARGTTMPDACTLTWPTATRVDRVIAWCASPWQSMSALVDFDVQTSVDGATWVTQATVTKTAPSSFQHGSDYNGVGCQQETFWDEQWIFDVKLPTPVTCKAVRLNVRATSYGGEPDTAAITAGGQGNPAQFITLQELAVLCDDNATPHYATR